MNVSISFHVIVMKSFPNYIHYRRFFLWKNVRLLYLFCLKPDPLFRNLLFIIVYPLLFIPFIISSI